MFTARYVLPHSVFMCFVWISEQIAAVPICQRVAGCKIPSNPAPPDTATVYTTARYKITFVFQPVNRERLATELRPVPTAGCFSFDTC